MVADEDTIPRRSSADPTDPGPGPGPQAIEDTVDRSDPGTAGERTPSGPRFDAPPPVRLAAPPAGAPLVARHRIRIGDTDEVALSAPVVVGRSPGAPRLAVPVLRVAVPSPTRQISADHLEVTEVGTTVVLRDLRSTNGSTVRIPGRPPRLLAAGETASVPAGTTVDLGDGVRIEILAPADPRA